MAKQQPLSLSLGIVVIGRNEGERLVRCLNSVSGFGDSVVYVDSGSSDGSVAAAHAAGAQVVELDMHTPFTAARARNAGLEVLGILPEGQTEKGSMPPVFVQFVDGDCELQPGWLERGTHFLQDHPDVAIVIGRLRERYPKASAYNALCDAEWNGPVGEIDSCGGIAMMRSAALMQTSLYNGRMIAGEEPELCLRLRAKGWKICRIDQEMALHDADMHQLRQFWARMRRGGFAFALWADMHGAAPHRMGVAQMRRALLWGAALPALILLSILVFGAAGLLFMLIYPGQVVRLVLRGEGWQNAFLLTLAKFAEAKGVAEFYWNRWWGRTPGLIEHKKPEVRTP